MEHYVNLFSNGASSPILLLISFLGGVVASLSPCSIAIIPLIMGYVLGFSNQGVGKTFLQLLFFVFGSSVVFSIIGIICALTGKVFISIGGAYFMLFIASFVMVMGLKLLNILDFEFPVFIKQIPKNEGNNLLLYPFIVGAFFALAGTPCSTPILMAIMSFAALANKIFLAVLMLFLFAVGQSLIIVLVGVGLSKVKSMKALNSFSEVLLKISGILLILASIYIFYKIFAPYIVN